MTEATGALLLVTTTRPGHAVPAPQERCLDVDPLTGDESEEMMGLLLGVELSSAVHDLVVRRSEGNPFFVEELVSTLIDQGTLVRDGPVWVETASAVDLAVPDTVTAVLAARVDLLTPVEKRALQTAAVIGRVVIPEALASLCGTTPTELDALVERDFLRHGEEGLVIKHALTREVAYGGLTRADRAQLHASFAEWLEASGTDHGDRAGPLAEHYARAVDPDIAELAWRGQADRLEQLRASALVWLRRAAEVAIARYDVEAALGLLRRALDLTPDDASLWRAVGRANALKYDGEAYWTAMQTAIRLTDEPQLLAELYGELSVESIFRGATVAPRARPGGDRAMDRAGVPTERTGHPVRGARVHRAVLVHRRSRAGTARDPRGTTAG